MGHEWAQGYQFLKLKLSLFAIEPIKELINKEPEIFKCLNLRFGGNIVYEPIASPALGFASCNITCNSTLAPFSRSAGAVYSLTL